MFDFVYKIVLETHNEDLLPTLFSYLYRTKDLLTAMEWVNTGTIDTLKLTPSNKYSITQKVCADLNIDQSVKDAFLEKVIGGS
jgi:hypothetical protein